MRLELKTEPVGDIVADATLWSHLRVDASGSPAEPEDADYIRMLREMAASYLDGANGVMGRALLTQSWYGRLDAFPGGGGKIAIPLPPLQSIDAVNYVNAQGVSRLLDAGAYQIVKGRFGSWITPAYGKNWPSVRNQPDAITIEFTAGYGETEQDIPAAIRHAALLIIGTMYEVREAVNIGNIVTEIPHSADMLLAPYRVWGVA